MSNLKKFRVFAGTITMVSGLFAIAYDAWTGFIESPSQVMAAVVAVILGYSIAGWHKPDEPEIDDWAI